MKNLGTVGGVLIGLGVLGWVMWVYTVQPMWFYAVRPARLLGDLLHWAAGVVGGVVVCTIFGCVVCGCFSMARDHWRARPK
jgi:hypothetical protein